MKRAQNKVRRILMLIDALAPLRMPFTLQDAMHRLAERSGSKVKVTDRTIRRDMELLISMDFAYVHRKGTIGLPQQFKMNLKMTSAAETAAIKHSEQP